MLQTEFKGNFSDENRIIYSRIPLTSNLANTAFRNTLWKSLLDIVAHPDCINSLHTLMWNYAKQTQNNLATAAVMKADLPLAAELFQAIASRDKPADCALATALNRIFLSHDLEEFSVIADSFQSEANTLARAITPNWTKAATSFQAEEDERRARLIDEYAGRSAQSVANLFASAAEIPNIDQHELSSAWQSLLDHWAEFDPPRLIAASAAGLPNQMAQIFYRDGWISALLRGCGKAATQTAILDVPTELRDTWRQTYLTSLPASEITPADAEEYLAMMSQIGAQPCKLGGLQNLIQASPRFLNRLVQALINRHDGAASIAVLLALIRDEQVKLLRQHFGSEPELLAQAYLKVTTQPTRLRFDRDATLMNLLIDLKPSFLEDYIKERFTNSGMIFETEEDLHDYRRLWQRPDWPDRFFELLEALVKLEGCTHQGYLAAWLPLNSEQDHSPIEIFNHLKDFIDRHAENIAFMRIVFGGIGDLPDQQRLDLYQTFLARNHDLNAFRMLPLLPYHLEANGSLGRIDFLERISNSMTSSEFIRHRMHIQRQIRVEQQQLDEDIEREFIERN